MTKIKRIVSTTFRESPFVTCFMVLAFLFSVSMLVLKGPDPDLVAVYAWSGKFMFLAGIAYHFMSHDIFYNHEEWSEGKSD